jgi:exodeoxyribonuclease VIII
MSVTHGLPFDDYLALPGWSNSALGAILRSPAHYQAYLAEPQAPTAAQLFGTAVHAATLEPDTFDDRYGVLPPGNGRTKAVKEAREKWVADNPGVIPITAEDGLAAAHMAYNVRKHCRLRHLFDGGQPEVVMQWTDPITGLACKGRADLWHPRLGIILDLKTTQDASPGEFGKSAGRMGYYRQAAFYVDGMYAALGLIERPKFVLAAIEKTPPFGVMVYALDEKAMAAGRDSYLAALDIARHCTDTDTWPAYPPDVQVLTLPAWAAL